VAGSGKLTPGSHGGVMYTSRVYLGSWSDVRLVVCLSVRNRYAECAQLTVSGFWQIAVESQLRNAVFLSAATIQLIA
jgi:hypothetical protein